MSKGLRGWIYVLVNPGLQGLVKIGYSTKDPARRAKELSSTGVPHEFEVAYEALVENPRDLEQRVHAYLNAQHESKEFFRATPTFAISAISAIAKQAGISLQLEQSSLLADIKGCHIETDTPYSPVSKRRSLAPSQIQARQDSETRPKLRHRPTHENDQRPKPTCAFCRSAKAQSPSGYCPDCFGRRS